MFKWVFYTNLGGTAEVTGFCPFLEDKGLFYIQFTNLLQIIQNKSKEEKDVHTGL